MQIDEVTAWEAFLGVAKKGTFSSASQHLKIPVPQVSKRVAKLESQLGVRLFQRTTRVVTLTEEGKALLPKIQSILEDLREAESLFESTQSLRGVVKVTCVPFVAHRLLLPILDEFLKLHPGIQIELELSERFLSIIDAGFDMAIRIETPKDSNLIYRRLAPNDLIFCASPKYLKGKPVLSQPKNLSQHNLLMLSIHHRCRFKNEDLTLKEFESAKKLTCDNGAFLTDMALNGMGILVRSIWDVRDHLKAGTLVQVLKKYPLETFGHIHAVVPSKRFLAPRVRAFYDFVVMKSQSWTVD
jgi:DNA-binding transcriptional LysR family regulator